MDVAEYLLRNAVTVADVIAAVNAVAALVEGDELYLSGSLVEGFGNSTSDLDVYLVTARAVVLQRTGPATILRVGSSTIDLECIHPDEIGRMLQRVPLVDVTSPDHRASLSWHAGDVDLFHRIVSAQHIWGSHKTLDAARSARTAFQRLVFVRCLAIVDAVQIDLVGAWDEGDVKQAMLLSNKLLGHGIDALCAAFGETNPAEKWRLAKLRKTASTQVFSGLDDMYFQVLSGISEENNRAHVHCTRVVNLCNWIIPQSQSRVQKGSDVDVSWLKLIASISGACRSGDGDRVPQMQLGVQVRVIGDDLILGQHGSSTVITIGRISHLAVTCASGVRSVQQIAALIADRIGGDREQIASGCRDLFQLLAHQGGARYIDRGRDLPC